MLPHAPDINLMEILWTITERDVYGGPLISREDLKKEKNQSKQDD